MDNSERIYSIKKYGKNAKGGTALLKYLNGKKLIRSEAILAKCYECMGYYSDGIIDCKIKSCPLYSFNYYRNK